MTPRVVNPGVFKPLLGRLYSSTFTRKLLLQELSQLGSTHNWEYAGLPTSGLLLLAGFSSKRKNEVRVGSCFPPAPPFLTAVPAEESLRFSEVVPLPKTR